MISPEGVNGSTKLHGRILYVPRPWFSVHYCAAVGVDNSTTDCTLQADLFFRPTSFQLFGTFENCRHQGTL